MGTHSSFVCTLPDHSHWHRLVVDCVQVLGVDTLLQVPIPSERGGVGMPTEEGYQVYDLDVLSQRLHAAMHQALNSSNLNGLSATEQELQAACQFALQHATDFNAWLQCAAAQLKAVQAWRLLAELAVAQRWVTSLAQ